MIMEFIVAGLFVFGLILWRLAFHYALMPYLLMIALGALGHEFSFIVCLAFWTVGRFIVKMLIPRKVVQKETK
jgi:hypothetical protein